MPSTAPLPIGQPQVLAAASSLEAELEAAALEIAPGQPLVRDLDRFSGHRVRLDLFIGPLDLLLYLVRAHRYDICDIPISRLTGQYLEWLSLLREAEGGFDWDGAGDFLVTAATLMQIKSRMLLPQRESANEDAMAGEPGSDPRRELVEKLLEYERFQAAAAGLRGRREERELVFPRASPLDQTLRELPDLPDEDQARAEALLLANVSSFDLLQALKRVLDRVSEPSFATIEREPFTIQERTREVWARLRHREATFGALCEDCESRLEVVITFLAVLELIRRGKVVVRQQEAFEEIFLAPREGSEIFVADAS